jgi:hypothetical protein
MTFQCFHCGQCCENVSTQINVNVGDVLRLSQFLKKPVEELIPEYISMNPFGSPDSESYELDLGLNIPCKFRKSYKCSVYEARPLNCRLFPMWIIASVPSEQLQEVIALENQCRNNPFDKQDQEKCKRYVSALTRIFDAESQLTDLILGPRQAVSPRDYPGLDELEEVMTGNERENEKIKIRWLMARIKQDESLAERIILAQCIFLGIEELKIIEEKTKPF